jgi:hypothetical protein
MPRSVVIVLFAMVTVFAVITLLIFTHLHWLAVHTGTAIPNGAYNDYYNFWSGIGSDFGELTLVSAFVVSGYTLYRAHECQSKDCHRLWDHPYEKDGVVHKLCKRCHPEVDHKNPLYRHDFAAHYVLKNHPTQVGEGPPAK